MDILELRTYCLSFPESEETTPFDETTLVYKVAGKMFAMTDMIHADHVALKCDPSLALDLREMFPGGVKVIGNFPYNISSQIFFKILENRDLVPESVGMVQKEVAVRLAEPPGSRDYGILSVLLQAWYDIEYLFTVHEHVFNPPPKVKSAVIRLRRNGTRALGCDEALFVRVVKAAFSQRRKMLKNPLKAVFGDFGGAEHPWFTRRAETLSVAEFVELTRWVEVHGTVR